MNARDGLHARATKVIRDALARRIQLVTTNLVLAEVQRLLVHRVGPEAGRRFLERVDASPSLEIYYATEDDHAGARQWLEQLADHHLTYTDAVSFAVLERSKRMGVLTFDADFTTAGFTPWTGDPSPSGTRSRGRRRG